MLGECLAKKCNFYPWDCLTFIFQAPFYRMMPSSKSEPPGRLARLEQQRAVDLQQLRSAAWRGYGYVDMTLPIWRYGVLWIFPRRTMTMHPYWNDSIYCMNCVYMMNICRWTWAHISVTYVGTGILEMGASMYVSGEMCIGMQGSMHGCLCVTYEYNSWHIGTICSSYTASVYRCVIYMSIWLQSALW